EAKPEKPVKRGDRKPLFQRQLEALAGGFHLLSDLPVRHFRTAGRIDPLNTGLQVVGKFIGNAVQILFKAVDAAKPLAVEQDIFLTELKLISDAINQLRCAG